VTERFSYLDHLQCPRCQARYPAQAPRNLCHCGSPLLAGYDLDALRAALTPARLASRPPDLWRYHELLPVASAERVVSLGEPMTPLLMLPKLGASLDLADLWIKDDASLPTGTFKARGAAIGVSRAVELGIDRIAMPTNGNAGAAWAAYAAKAGLRCLVVMPEDAPEITRKECVVTGAEVHLVAGRIDDAGKMVARLVAGGEFFDVSTLKEPYRLEGKKTLGLEIAEQLGWRPPDVIVYPTGGGVGLLGIWKALQELRALGWLDGTLPRMVAVQATGCAPIVRAFEAGETVSQPWERSETIAFGITVPKPLGDFLILETLRQSHGRAVAVDDRAILADQAEMARREGRFICPEGAATVSAVRMLRQSGWLRREDRTLLINTGTGLKYPETVTAALPVLRPGEDIRGSTRRSGP